MSNPIILNRRAFLGGSAALAGTAMLQPAWAHSGSEGLAAKATGTLSGEDIRLTVAETASRLGYVELSSFSQAFRRWHGMSPRAFRASRT